MKRVVCQALSKPCHSKNDQVLNPQSHSWNEVAGGFTIKTMSFQEWCRWNQTADVQNSILGPDQLDLSHESKNDGFNFTPHTSWLMPRAPFGPWRFDSTCVILGMTWFWWWTHQPLHSKNDPKGARLDHSGNDVVLKVLDTQPVSFLEWLILIPKKIKSPLNICRNDLKT